MEPHAKQQAFLEAGTRFVLAACGVQSGKSIAGSHKFLTRIRRDLETHKGPLNYWVVAPIWGLLYQSQRYLRELLAAGRPKWSGLSNGIYSTCQTGRVRVSFRTAEHPDRLVSEPVNGMLVDEVARMKRDAWSGALLGRLTATAGWAIACTSPLGQNWVYDEMYLPGRREGEVDYDADKVDSEWRSFVWYSEDNPGVDRQLLEGRKKSMPEAMYNREFRADFTAFHGKVYEDLSKARHVRPCKAHDYPVIAAAIDFGYGPGHPGALVIAGVNPQKRIVAIAEEHLHEAWTPDQWLELLVSVAIRYPALRCVYADSARPDLMALFRSRQPGLLAGRRRALDIVPAIKDVQLGIMAVAELVHLDQLLIDPSCVQTFRQMASYRWAERGGKNAGPWADVPVKADDDLVDCCRYLIMGMGLARRN